MLKWWDWYTGRVPRCGIKHRSDQLLARMRARLRGCVRVCVWVIDVCHKASPRMVLCLQKKKKTKKKTSEKSNKKNEKQTKQNEKKQKQKSNKILQRIRQGKLHSRFTTSKEARSCLGMRGGMLLAIDNLDPDFFLSPAAWIIVVVFPRFRYLALH